MSWLSDLFHRLFPPRPPGNPPPIPTGGGVVADLYLLHNSRRKLAGLPMLTLDSQLCNAAYRHAITMAGHRVCAHWGIGDGDPWSRMSAAGYSYRTASENVAAGQRDAAQAVADWMSSPGHRANILGTYDDVGFGMAKGGDGVCYWCADFGIRLRPFAVHERVLPQLPGPLMRSPQGA